MATLYDRIEYLLQQKGMTKKALAVQAGIPYTTLMSAFQRGKGSMSPDYVNQIAKVLGVSLSDLMNWDNEETILSAGIKMLDYAKLSDPEVYSMLCEYYQLNEAGRKKITDYVKDISKIPDYWIPKEEFQPKE